MIFNKQGISKPRTAYLSDRLPKRSDNDNARSGGTFSVRQETFNRSLFCCQGAVFLTATILGGNKPC